MSLLHTVTTPARSGGSAFWAEQRDTFWGILPDGLIAVARWRPSGRECEVAHGSLQIPVVLTAPIAATLRSTT